MKNNALKKDPEFCPENQNTPDIGTIDKKNGIYLGVWRPRDQKGHSLKKEFAIYAAPTDLQDQKGNRLLLTFLEATLHMANLRQWHGHNGIALGNKHIEEIIRSGREKELENWFIPNLENLNGHDAYDNKVQNNNLFAQKNTGAFKGTFATHINLIESPISCYWSCHHSSGKASYIEITNGTRKYEYTDEVRHAVRPIRAVLIKNI